MMLAHRLRPAARRLLHTTPRLLAAAGKDTQLSQGHASLPDKNDNLSGEDTHSQAARGGKDAKSGAASGGPLDAATQGSSTTPRAAGAGHKDVGSVEQVGGASGDARRSSMGGSEEAQSPGVLGSVKQALGLKTGADDVKHNRGAGRGVTGGPGPTRKMHTSAVWRYAVRADPDGAREPKDTTVGEQNEHLTHKKAFDTPDQEAGNASETPTLPSQKTPMTAANSKGSSGSSPRPAKTQTRTLMTSAVRRADASADPEQHSAESYFKEVDTTPSSDAKTHKVDSSSDALDAPGETATGPYHEAGTDSAEYEHANQDTPYAKPEGAQAGEDLRYGGKPTWSDDKGSQQSNSGDGPTGAAKDGVKP